MTARPPIPTSELRPDQARVVERCLEIARSRPPDRALWAHIVLPPRTGKTVIAAHVMARLAERAVFVVPTRVLVHQTRAEWAKHLPDVPTGVWFGERFQPVSTGLNVTT